MNKDGHFQVSPETLRYFGYLEKRGIHPDLQVLQAKSGGEFLARHPDPEAFKV